MPEIKIMVLQGEIKFTPKFTPEQVQHVRRQYAQPMRYLDFSTLNSLACKRYPIEIKNEKDIDDEFEYIVGLLQVLKPKVKFSGEMFGYHWSSDSNGFKKCKWFVRKDEKYFTHEYIEWRIVKPSKPRGPRKNANDRVLAPPDREQPNKVNINTQTIHHGPLPMPQISSQRTSISVQTTPQRRNPIPTPQIKYTNQSVQTSSQRSSPPPKSTRKLPSPPQKSPPPKKSTPRTDDPPPDIQNALKNDFSSIGHPLSL